MRTMITKWLPQRWRQKGRMLTASLMMMVSGAVAYAQAPANDECSGAIALPAPTGTCTNTAGTTVGATLSMAATPCFGNPDDDVWFSFVASNSDVKVDLSGITGTTTDMYFQVLSGTCGSMTSLLCSDPNSGFIGGLTPGQTYYIRVYTYGTGGSASFNLCVTNFTAAPASCASLTAPANNGQVSIQPTLTWGTVTNATTYDVYFGTTNPPTAVHTTVTGTSYAFTTPLLPATDYYWYVVPKNSIGSPTTCATNTRKFTTLTPPPNDQCANAVSLIQGATCVNTTGNTAGATLSMAATPCFGNPDDDVWYSFVATATDAKIDLSGVSGSTDMYFQVLSGTCGSMTSLLCSDPNSGIVGGLTTGQTYYIRVYTYGTGNATFSICVTNPPIPAACATLANPANNGQASTSPTLSWNTVTNATAYDIYFDGNNPPTTLAATVNGNATTSYTFPTPQPLGDYYWYVVPKNSTGAAIGCATNTRKLTVIPLPVNDNCPQAVNLTVNPDFNCGTTTSGHTIGATQSTETPPTVNAAGTNDDVWYKFTATGTFHRITLSNISGSVTDMAMAIYSGSCGALTHIQSSDPNTMDVSGLTPGQIYTVRVYTYTATVGSSASFNICVGSMPPPPPNDDCGGAITLTVNPDYNCAATTTGTTIGGTQSTETAPTVAATGTDDDVWYSFTATNSTHIISLSDISGTVVDMAMAIYSGSCGALVHIQSSDPNSMGATGLIPGQVYKVRVYTYTSTFSDWTTTFKICVGTPPAPPANDNCGGAVTLTVNPDYNCGVTTNGTTAGATASTETAPTVGATGVNDDVWYTFTATNATHLIRLSNVTGSVTDMAMAVYSGACGALVHIQSSDPDMMTVTGLTPGQSYKVRVYTYTAAITGWATSFTICVGTPPPAPANDNCGGAITLTVNPDYNCGVTATGSTFAATQSTETAPTVAPTGTNDDVWYTFTATNAIHTISLSNVFGTATDMAMAVYSGACGALVHIQSSDPNEMMVTGLTPGQSYKVRVYTYSATATNWATFTICVGTPPAPPANNDCANAQSIAQLTTCVTTAGTTSGATLSMAATPCAGNPDDDVWYSFVATGTDAQVSISGTTSIFGGSLDMYFQVLSGACGSLTSLLCSDPNVNTVTGLTPGQVYYIRVYTYDPGNATAFNICVTNVSTPTLCLTPTGFNVPAASVTANAATLSWTAPALGIPTGYQWEVRSSGVPGSGPTGLAASGSTTTATTATTGPVLSGFTTYSAYVRTNCIAGNTSDWSTAVIFTTFCSNPPVIVSKKDSSRCGNGSVVLEASSVAGTQIRWYTAPTGGSPIGTGSPFTTPPIAGATTYYASAAIGTGNLCEGPRVAVNATINTPPTATISPAGPIQICAGSSTTLMGGGGGNYQWRNAAGNIAGQTNASLIVNTAGSYHVVAIDALTGCSDTSVSVVVNSVPAPVVNLGNDTVFCSGGTLTLNAGNPSATFLWDNSSTAQTRAVTATGTYYVKATIGNCEDSDTITVTVNPVPVVNLGNDTTICHNATLMLNAGNPGATYAWSNGTTAQTLAVNTAGTYSVVVTDANTCVGTDNITVNTTSPPDGDINAVYGSAATYTFNVLNPQNATAYTWDFGDGSPKTPGNPVQHTYTANGTYTVSLILKGDCSDSISKSRTVDVFDAGGTGIPSVISNNDLLLYPNPATDIVTLENRNNLKMKQVTVYNIVGQVVSSTKADSNDKHQLQTRSLAQGVYTLRIETDKGVVIRKFEIVR